MAAIDFIVVPYDSGRRGWRMGAGPDALLADGLADGVSDDGHDVAITRIESESEDPLASAVEHAVQVAESVRSARAEGRFPIVLAGNCIATVGAVAGARYRSLALAWLDAHADLNTPETSPGGFLDGMGAATLLGWCHAEAFARVPGYAPLAADHLVLVGGRSFDPAEVDVITRGTVALLTPDEARDAIRPARLTELVHGSDGAWMHLDVDVLDPVECGPANIFATPDGLTVDAARRVFRDVAAAAPLLGLTVTAYDPAVDASGSVRAATVQLVHTAVDLANGGR